MKEKEIKNILKIVVVMIFIVIAIPIIFQLFILGNDVYSTWDDTVWGGFLGSLWGGAIGGVGTLIAVYFSTNQTRKIQEVNDQKQIDDKFERARLEKVKFADNIIIYVGRYITDINKYYDNCRVAERNDDKLRNIKIELKSLQSEIKNLNTKMAKTNDEELLEIDRKIENLKIEEQNLQRKYNEIELDKQKNRADRTIANECYFILKMHLNSIDVANELIQELENMHNNLFNKDYTWIDTHTNSLMKLTEEFKQKYI